MLLALASTPPMTGYPAGIDTDMLAGIEAPKTPPAEVAAALLDGLTRNEEVISPDPSGQAISRTWWSDPTSFERAFSGAAAA